MKVSTGKIHTIMKTKNIFLTAISALFIFAACTEEKIIDEPGVSGKGDLVIELSPSSVITKAAATDKGYDYATEEELNVDDCWIFVFGESNQYITSQYFSGDNLLAADNGYVDNPGPNGESQTYKKGYKVTLKGLNYGTYDFWVVANPTESNDAYGSCRSLSALKDIIEGGDTYKTAFVDKANQLVKVGNKSATFNTTTVASPIQIPLTQLAARVELKVRVDIPRQLLGGEYEYEGFPNANGVLTNTQIDALTGTHSRNDDITNAQLQEKDSNGNFLYTYFGHPVKVSGKEPKAIWVNSALKVIKHTKYKGYLLNEIQLTVDDIRIKSELKPLSVTVGQLDNSVFEPLEEQISTTYLFKFYTYAKDDLTIGLSGKLQEAAYSVSQTGTLEKAVFVNDKYVALVKKINGGKVEDDEVLVFEGGSGWGNTATGVLLCNEDAWTAVDEAITGDPIPSGEIKEYSSGSVTLKPEGGFQVGNMYEASALIKNVPATGSLNIVIEKIQPGGKIDFGFN